MASLFRSRTRLDIPDLRRRRRRTTKLDRRISAGHGVKLLEAHLKQPRVFALSGSMLIQIITPKRLYTYSPLPIIFVGVMVASRKPIVSVSSSMASGRKTEQHLAAPFRADWSGGEHICFVVSGLSWTSWKVFSFRHGDGRL